MRIFVDQPASLVIDEVLGFDSLRHHCSDETETLYFRVVISLSPEFQVHTERADRSALHDDRNAHICDFLFVQIAFARSIQEHGFAAHFRNHDRPTGLDHTAGNPLAQTVPGETAAVAYSAGYFDTDLLAPWIQQGYRSAKDGLAPFQDFQDPLKGDSC